MSSSFWYERLSSETQTAFSCCNKSPCLLPVPDMFSDVQEQERQPSPALEGQARADLDGFIRYDFEWRANQSIPHPCLGCGPFPPSLLDIGTPPSSGTDTAGVNSRQSPKCCRPTFQDNWMSPEGKKYNDVASILYRRTRYPGLILRPEPVPISRGQLATEVSPFLLPLATSHPLEVAAQSKINLETAIANELIYQPMISVTYQTPNDLISRSVIIFGLRIPFASTLR